MTDHRAMRGRRYEAALVLTLLLLAKLAGKQTLRGIAQWVQLRVAWLQTVLPLARACLPGANSYRYICAHIDQVFQLQRQVVRRQRTRVEFNHGLTSLPVSAASPVRLLQLVRHHWRRDTRLGEDACRVRSGRTPYSLAALNSAVLAIMDYLGVKNVADQLRIFAAQSHVALNLLLCSL